MNSNELYWLAGILEGEGSFLMSRTSPTIQIAMTDMDVVERAAILMRSSTPRPMLGKRGPGLLQWRTRCFGDTALELMRLLLPHMGMRRTEQILNVIKLSGARSGYARGDRNYNSKLRAEHIPLIRYLSTKGLGYKRLAKMCGVNPKTIRDAVLGNTWKHI